MLQPDWNAELDECRDKEKIVLQILRETDDPSEVLEICEAFGPKGSLYTIPVLMAKMINATDPTLQSYYMATLAIIMGRIQGWERGAENDFFNPPGGGGSNELVAKNVLSPYWPEQMQKASLMKKKWKKWLNSSLLK